MDYKKAIEALQTFSPASAIGEDFLTHLDRLVDQKGGILENIIVFTTESASSVEDLNRVKQVYIERLEKMQDLLEAYESKYRGHKNFSEYYHPVKVPQIKNGGGGAAGVGAGVNIGNNNQPGDSATSSSDEDLSSLSLSDSEDHDHQESHVNTDISAKNKESIDNPSLTKEDGKYEDEEAEEAVTSNTVLPHATAKSVKRSSRKPSVSFSDSNTSSSKNKSSVESAANAFTTASQTILSKLQETFEKRSSRYRDSSIFTNSSSSTSTTTAAKSAAALGGFFKNFSGGLNPAPSSSLSAFSGSTSDRGVGSAAVTGPTSSLITGLNGILDTFEKWKANRQAEFLRLEKLTNNLSKSLTDQFSHILLGGCDGEFEDSSSNNNNNDNTPPYSTGSATMQFRIQHCISIQQELIAAIAEENQARLAFDPPHSSIREGLRLACQLDYKAVWQIEEITQVFSKLKLVGAQWKRTEYMANDVKFNELYKLQKESRKKMMFAKIEEEDDDPFSTVSIMSSSSSEKRSKKQRAYKDALKEFRCAASLVEEEMFKLKSLASAMYPELFVRLPWLKSTVEFVGSPEVGVFHRSLDLYDVLENNNDSNMDPDSASGALNAVNVGNVAFFKAKIGVRECMLKKVRHLPTESDRQEFIKLSKHQLKYLQHPNVS